MFIAITSIAKLALAAGMTFTPNTPHHYTVRPGDTLSGIAATYRITGGWPSLYAANRRTVGGDPDLIFPGQRLTLTGRAGTLPRRDGDGDFDGDHTAAAPSGAPATAPAVSVPSGGVFSFTQLERLWVNAGGPVSQEANAACIAEHESSGNAAATGAAGEIGLWQLWPTHTDASYVPSVNARGAVLLWQSQGWAPWTTAPMCGL